MSEPIVERQILSHTDWGAPIKLTEGSDRTTTTITMAAPIAYDETSHNRFRDEYKRYKRRDKPCDFSEVIDCHSQTEEQSLQVKEIELQPPTYLPQLACFKPLEEWKAYELKDCPGFLVIPNPFVNGYQRYWVKRCTQDYPVKPNVTNLDALMERPDRVWETCQTENGPDLQKDSYLMKLRWATLGYHFDYNKEEYYADRQGAFPEDLGCLASYVATVLGFPQFHGEAAIVNFYRLDSAMGGHTDHSELDHEAPLVSFSFGQDAVFLIGGPTKATKPVALFLHSGDISVMTGPSRLAYHAVPRMVPVDSQYLDNCFNYSQAGMESTLQTDKLKDTHLSNELYDSDPVKEGSTACDKCEPCNGKGRTSLSDRPIEMQALNRKVDTDMEKQLNSGVSDNVEQDHSETIGHAHHAVSVQCSCELAKKIVQLNKSMKNGLKYINWEPFEKFLTVTRVNCNIRQVLRLGQSFPKKKT